MRTDTSMTIGELARRAGVAVTTIRAWEQRYGLLAPARSPGGHRRYSAEDLRRLRAVQAMVSQGVTLTAAAQQVMGEGEGEAAPTPPAPAPAPARRRAAPPPVPQVDAAALRAAYRATRALLAIRRPGDAVDVLVALVEELGGSVVEADRAGPDALPLDVSLGDRAPLLPVADPYSVARLHLERVLPTVVEDARRAAALVARRRPG